MHWHPTPETPARRDRTPPGVRGSRNGLYASSGGPPCRTDPLRDPLATWRSIRARAQVGSARTTPTLGALIGVLGALGACAHGGVDPTGTTHDAAEVDVGRAHAAPTLGSLPAIPEGSSAATACTRHGILAAREVLDRKLPAPPPDRRHRVLQAWVNNEVAAWMRARQRAVEDAAYEFQVGGAPTIAETIVQRATIGLLHEDTATAIAALPAPAELTEEPAAAAVFAEVMHAHAKPFLSAALVEFRECSDLAFDGPEDMRHWARYCQIRFARMRALVTGTEAAEAGADATTLTAR